MFGQTTYVLAFKDGHYDFKSGAFVPELVECMARVPTTFPSRVQADIDEVQRRLSAPIFNDDAELQATFLTFVARGLAGLVADKAWGAGLGERNSGKSVLCGL